MRCSIRSAAGILRGALVVSVVASCADLRPTTPALADVRALTTVERAASHLPPLRISEFHYDNSGTDVNERVEISGPAGTNLSGWSVVLYNGANGLSYQTTPLSGSIPATCDGRGVVVVEYPSNGIQNGAPDGIALINNGSLIEFLSYEGTFTAMNGPALGAVSIEVGVFQSGSEPTTASLFRRGSGQWFKSSATFPSTFGACNDSDDVLAIDRIAVTPGNATINEGGAQQFTATAFDADDNALIGVTFAWTSSATAVATVSRGGLATGAGVGDAEIRASAGGRTGTAALRVNEAPLPNLPSVRFTEVHYDNVGTDVGEALEIEGPAGADLTGWSVVLYNGSGGAAYDTRMLAGTLPNSCDGRGVTVVRYEQDGIQNGSPDGFALVNASGAVVEFLSYEGAFEATNGPAAGQRSVDIGVSQPGSTPHFRTLQRRASGRWDAPAPSTLGGCYGSTPVTPVNQISFSGRSPFDTPLPVGFEDQLFGTLRAPDDSPVPTTFTWEALTPSVATIDARGVMHALAAGTATFRATAGDGTSATYSLPTIVATASTTARYGNHVEFGEPADADPSDDFILRRTEFTSSFNPVRNIPNWVSYNLEATHIQPGQDRCDCFTYDPLLPGDFTRYTTADYTGAGAAAGFEINRGHLARSFDRTAGSLDNARTFYFSNIIPQAADNNQGPWGSFENYLGNLAQNENREVYIVTGASGSQGTVKNEGVITIPAITWKVAVIMPRDHGLTDMTSYGAAQVIAVIMPNRPGIRTVDWRSYVTTVNAVEEASGYDVLALLSDEIERIVEAGMQEELGMIDALESAGTIGAGVATSLRGKLTAAAHAHDRGNVTAARNQLNALINEIDALARSRRLDASNAVALKSAIEALIETL